MISLFFKFFIMMNLSMITSMTLFFNDLMIIWFFMEIMNFLFMYVLINSMKNKKMIFFYFLIQIIPSFSIIFTLILNNIIIFNNFLYIFLLMGLLMKLSIPPFHLWLPIMSKHMSWYSLFILLTIMKIPPFYMMSLIYINNLLIYFITILSSIIPPFMLLNLYNIKMILSYSSINQSGWMVILISLKNIIWLKYFLFYSLTLMNIFIIMTYFKLFSNYSFNNMKISLNMLNLIFIFNLAGMPPFSFFYMKWYSMFTFILYSNYFIMFIMLMISSLFMLFIYTNMLIYTMFLFKFKSKMLNYNNPPLSMKTYLILFMNSLLSLILFII
uniref:NADH-ubiquinone oxidoreductase chain 2 n=1 Tax=Monomorium pharaonis TaxID=307658 RepID=A0A7L8EYE1_MONPH|nr:NADH dehydrogenase subunit 2 [Monomorium pharaonis]QOE17529.1 NADH dehydrogenase subunit 2 [Monomorium pharaonis]